MYTLLHLWYPDIMGLSSGSLAIGQQIKYVIVGQYICRYRDMCSFCLTGSVDDDAKHLMIQGLIPKLVVDRDALNLYAQSSFELSISLAVDIFFTWVFMAASSLVGNLFRPGVYLGEFWLLTRIWLNAINVILVCLLTKDIAINIMKRPVYRSIYQGFQLLNVEVLWAISLEVESILTFCLMILRFIVSTRWFVITIWSRTMRPSGLWLIWG